MRDTLGILRWRRGRLFEGGVMAESDVPQILDYAGPRDRGVDGGPPLDSRLVFERLADGVRITDPPAGWKGGAGPALVAVVAVVLGGALAVWMVEAVNRGDVRRAVLRGIGVVGAGCLAVALVEESRRRAKRPTVIEVRGGKLVIQEPSVLTARMEWAAGKVKAVRTRFAIPTLNPPRMVSAVQIIPAGLEFSREVLRNRPVEEVKWVVGVLKRELGLGHEG
jgi:hypothetical protein